ncbi:secondary thiamine-phosphate synthase enzyme [candidate division WOR-1 bacterium RIFOXYD2_FULL_36_8]|uniref:Secondary thiamine-phosphate synthase enzyme n=1 Tax=candidate division WOR-1 bacterium RIFOXYB2_FULL_36_35 TaxID=1802578 RepID=A0A1F4S1H2_UNCSA|nr:MAG: secondary thiamine-phosphate synthase enzyme [candidate division WOR-1 bacterium RIFOXYB2_FULL_36_35]OGC16496.1 MAG: secondary thiamine-phosphate synthase enzyme [candidate division WOR-1 bacterium RIFOXYA12_FULL_36_13]OGC37553.1 MAG: secondary thiamine-phosphate synthase enzyme [candidate division WOR-1 bacterium RIFOXYD2_FULL_36_8]
MKTYTEYLWINTKNKREIINITDEVFEIIKKSGIEEGLALVSAMHITASIFVNDEESGIKQDFLEWAEKLAPFNINYHHHQTGETNGDAHLKSILFHHEVIIPVTNGNLDFGPWQQVFYGEFDGQRKKRIVVKVMGE